MSKEREIVVKTKIKKSKDDKIFDFFLYLIAGILILITLYPMYFIVIASISVSDVFYRDRFHQQPDGCFFRTGHLFPDRYHRKRIYAAV